MKVFNLNVNDFGGTDIHLEEYKKLYGPRWCMKKWDDIDKSKERKGIADCVHRYFPDVVILQEYDFNSKEAFVFKKEMVERGYVLNAENTKYNRPSMTVFFIKNDIEYSYVKVGHTLNGRAYAIKIEDTIIYGTHVPPKYDSQFWREIYSFVENISSEKYILIGDFNTINYKNQNEVNNILKNAQDVWKEKGNNKPISVMGDYVIASKNIEMDDIEIHSFDEKLSDHPIILLNISMVKNDKS